ncbi:MAG TPA: type II toxin-antitoxin system VapC family toxin [Methylomirabilota bacterium]|nr:type II toxin-antitoxin system VapC family toxin [Methylomirabilota bacterium]
MIVLDASAAVELLLVTAGSAAVRERVSRIDETLHVPHLFDVEVVSALRRHRITGTLGHERAREALDDFLQLRAVRYPHQVLLPRIWELARTLTAYDAAYIALAEALRAPLVTFDGHLARTTGHRAQVELLET